MVLITGVTVVLINMHIDVIIAMNILLTVYMLKIQIGTTVKDVVRT